MDPFSLAAEVVLLLCGIGTLAMRHPAPRGRARALPLATLALLLLKLW